MPKADISKIYGRNYEVPPDLEQIIRRATRGSPISYEVAVQIFGSEGGFDKSARSPTGALGIAQFTQDAFLQAAKSDIKSLPEKYWKTIDSGDEKTILKLRKDPEVAITLGVKYMEWTASVGWKNYKERIQDKIDTLEKASPPPTERLANLGKEFHREMTVADLKILYVCGVGGGSELLAALAEENITGGHKARDYTSETVANSNPVIFKKVTYVEDVAAKRKHHGHNKYNEKDKHVKKVVSDRSVSELQEYIAERVGGQPLRGGGMVATVKSYVAPVAETLKQVFAPVAPPPAPKPASPASPAKKPADAPETFRQAAKAPTETPATPPPQKREQTTLSVAPPVTALSQSAAAKKQEAFKENNQDIIIGNTRYVLKEQHTNPDGTRDSVFEIKPR